MKRQPTTQQITWFLDLHRNKQLDLEPPYQRKSVWSSKDRKFFLDTVFRNYPAPPIFIHRTVDDKGYTTYHIVDGKQRLETILQFYDNKISVGSGYGDVNLDGKKFKDLPTEYKRRFWDYTIVVDFIDSIEGSNIEEVFDRVNRNAKNLQPQELRHARFNGWFINIVESEAEEDFWWDRKISTRGRDKRMKNVQFISELLLIILENKIVGFDQEYLDENYAKYDDTEDLVESGQLNLELFSERLLYIKNFITQADLHNNCISDFANGSNNNFYTLWAYIQLNNPADTIAFATGYAAFMQQIEQVPVNQLANTPLNENVLNYFNNSRGAVTEPSQREERLKALTNFLSA